MLQFFRINDPYRIIFVGLVLIVIRLPFMVIMNGQLSLEELNWLTVGDALNKNGELYGTLITDIAPFAAWVYQLLDFIFGSSKVVYHLLAILLTLLQSYLFNVLLLRSKVFEENTFIPAVLYVIFMTFHFDTVSLSPALMGLTFVLLSVNNVLERLDQATGDDLFSTTGIYLAVASLFYFPYILFLPAALMSLLVLSNPKARRVVLLLFCFGIVYASVFSFFYYQNALDGFQSFFLGSNLTLNRIYLVSLERISSSIVPIVAIAILSTLSVVFSPSYTSSQRRVFYAILIFHLFGMIATVFTRRISPATLIIFVIPASFFLTHYLLKFKRRWLAELLFNLCIVVIVGFALFPLIAKGQEKNYLIARTKVIDENTSLLVLADDFAQYADHQFAGDFLDWKLSEPVFRRVQSIDNLVRIEGSIMKNKPDLILDPSGYMDAIFEIVPTIGNIYERSTSNSNLVINKESYPHGVDDALLQIR